MSLNYRCYFVINSVIIWDGSCSCDLCWSYYTAPTTATTADTTKSDWRQSNNQIESVVTPSGNSGHVVVPKDWLSKAMQENTQGTFGLLKLN
jgi:hypothetical protein